MKTQTLSPMKIKFSKEATLMQSYPSGSMKVSKPEMNGMPAPFFEQWHEVVSINPTSYSFRLPAYTYTVRGGIQLTADEGIYRIQKNSSWITLG
jgi:hypothetical protein